MNFIEKWMNSIEAKFAGKAQEELIKQYDKDPTGQMVTPQSEPYGFGFQFRNEPYGTQARLSRNLDSFSKAAFQTTIGSPSAVDSQKRAEFDYANNRNFMQPFMGSADRVIREDLANGRYKLGMKPVDYKNTDAKALKQDWDKQTRKETQPEYAERRTAEISAIIPGGKPSIIQQVCQERAQKEIASLPQQYEAGKGVRTVVGAAA